MLDSFGHTRECLNWENAFIYHHYMKDALNMSYIIGASLLRFFCVPLLDKDAFLDC